MAVTWAWAALLVMIAFVVLVLATDRRSDRRAWKAWEGALLDETSGACVEFHREVGARLLGVDQALTLARAAHALDASRALRHAALGALRLVRRLDRWLHTWRDTARALAALRPVQVRRPWSFRSWRLRWLALGRAISGALWAGSRAHFDAHLRFLGRALAVVRRVFLGIARRRRTGATQMRADLRTAEQARDDLRTLASDCLTALQALETSRSAQGGTPGA